MGAFNIFEYECVRICVGVLKYIVFPAYFPAYMLWDYYTGSNIGIVDEVLLDFYANLADRL